MRLEKFTPPSISIDVSEATFVYEDNIIRAIENVLDDQHSSYYLRHDIKDNREGTIKELFEFVVPFLRALHHDYD